MCGICGAASTTSRAVSVDAVERGCAAIRHRGPDHGAVKNLGHCVLGYRRLRVIDLATGDQPVTNETGDVTVVFNGELYGFDALRRELLGNGHELQGTGDTPTLPHLYEEHGPRFAERLDGMFAIAVWDASRDRLVLVRDRFGKKPLLWTQLPNGDIAFASELKAILEFPGVPRRPGLLRLDAFLALGYVPGSETALDGIHRLPPGSMLVAEKGEIRIERYWAPTPRPLGLTRAESIAAVRDAVVRAVQKRLVADVPLGALLSGGIDSSVVVAAMAQTSSTPVRTFSVGFDEERYDERRYARTVADHLGTTHEEILVEPDAASLLPRLAAAYDEPFGDTSALPTFLLCEHTKRFVTVALTGDGGDEVFGGYERYRAHALAQRLDLLPSATSALGARLLRALPGGRTEPRSPLFRAARFLETAGLDNTERYGQLMELFPVRLRESLWTPAAREEIGTLATAGRLLGPRPQPGITGLQLIDIATYLPGDILFKADIASMANSLELRSPLLDHDLAEIALGLPDELKLHRGTGKVALREAFAPDLPAAILARGKAGFGVPVGRWFRDDLRELATDLLLDTTASSRGLFRREGVAALLADHAAGRADHGERIWALVMLELWQRQYVERSTR